MVHFECREKKSFWLILMAEDEENDKRYAIWAGGSEGPIAFFWGGLQWLTMGNKIVKVVNVDPGHASSTSDLEKWDLTKEEVEQQFC